MVKKKEGWREGRLQSWNQLLASNLDRHNTPDDDDDEQLTDETILVFDTNVSTSSVLNTVLVPRLHRQLHPPLEACQFI